MRNARNRNAIAYREETQKMAQHSVQPVRTTTDTNVERIVFSILMIGAPILMLGAAFLHPPHSIDNGTEYYHAAHDFSARFYVAHTLFFSAAVLFVPAVVGLARLVHIRRPKAAFWGCVLSLMGFIGYGALDGADYFAWVAGNPDYLLDPEMMQKFITTALSSMPIMIPILLVFSLLPIGLGVLAVGAVRGGILPAWLAVLMPVGMTGMASFLEHPIPLVLSALALLASFGTLGVKLLRAPNGAQSQAPPV
jgi:hypothetical protein